MSKEEKDIQNQDIQEQETGQPESGVNEGCGEKACEGTENEEMNETDKEGHAETGRKGEPEGNEASDKETSEERKEDEEVKEKSGWKKDKKKDGESKAEKELAEARKEIETLKAAVAKEKDDYVRLMADFENFRRHSAQDKLNLVTSAAADTIKGMLPVLDDCENALKMLEDSKDEAAKEGTRLIYDKLMGYLKSRGLEPIKAKGEVFDTDFHEAVTQFPVQEDDKKGKVFDVLQTGYTLSGKVIRYAKVVVGI